MAQRRAVEKKPRGRPATTAEGKELQLIALAVELAEKQIREGTVSAQVLAHYLKLGTQREKLEQERLRQENLLTGKKVEAIESQKRIEDLYENALNAMRVYTGGDFEYNDDDA